MEICSILDRTLVSNGKLFGSTGLCMCNRNQFDYVVVEDVHIVVEVRSNI